MAEDQAAVAAKSPAHIVSHAVERGTSVAEGGVLVRVSPTEADAQALEAEANAAQIEARLGLTAGNAFDVNAVPEVQHAKSSYELAQHEFERVQSLLDQRVVSQSEFEQRRMPWNRAALRSPERRRPAVQALQAARARVAIANKAVADTVVRAPFNGLVAERLVSVGDYVTKGAKVAVVVRVNPLRVQLTVPEQFVSAISVGAPVTFEVDAYPGRSFNGTVRYVSPSLSCGAARADRRLRCNPAQELKPAFPRPHRSAKPTPR
jgi:multidrug resistance efflux pump